MEKPTWDWRERHPQTGKYESVALRSVYPNLDKDISDVFTNATIISASSSEIVAEKDGMLYVLIIGGYEVEVDFVAFQKEEVCSSH